MTRSFRGRAVLRDVTLRIPRGTLAVVEGANGAGKTTLLRIFATVVRPDRGQALLDGYDAVREGARVRERLGAAFVNERSLYWRLSGRENLRLFARMHGLGPREARAEVDRLLAALDLLEPCDRWVSDLSAGQRQRLVVARAGLGEPGCMVVDEPLRGLDDGAIAATLSFLRAQAARGAAVLVAAPKLDELEGEIDVAYRLRDGAVEQ